MDLMAFLFCPCGKEMQMMDHFAPQIQSNEIRITKEQFQEWK